MKDIFKILKKKVYSIGLMSGTSLDGIDVALVEHYKNNHKLIDFRSYEYPLSLKERIMEVSKLEASNIQLVCSVNKELGLAYTKAIEQFLIDKVPEIWRLPTIPAVNEFPEITPLLIKFSNKVSPPAISI